MMKSWGALATVLAVCVVLNGCAGATPVAPDEASPSAAAPSLPTASTPEPTATPSPLASADPADFAPVDFGTGVVFNSPDRNLACGILSVGDDAGPSLWGCAITEQEWAFSTADPSDFCFDSQVPCGRGIEALGSDEPHPRKRGDAAFESEYSSTTRELPIGSSLTFDDVQCDSTESGITCSHLVSGHGFTISRTSNEIW